MESRNFIARENHVCMVIGSEDELKFNACQGTQEADISIGDDRVIRFMDYASIRLMLACLMQAARELRFGPPLLTEKMIAERATSRERLINKRVVVWTCWCLAVFGLSFAVYTPVHAWLHAHLQLLLGFLLGTLAQSVPWLIDHWRWMKWFSHQ